MKDTERVLTPEPDKIARVDAVIVLGRNFQPGFDRKVVAEQRFNLSPQSRINSLAAGLLYKSGYTNTLILSTGHTAGSNVPSEAAAMKSHILSIFKDVPEEAFILEENSIDTDENVREVMKIIDRQDQLETFGVLTDTSQLSRVVLLFERAGLPIQQLDSLTILGKQRPEFIEEYIQSELYGRTTLQDNRAKLIQSLPLVSPITSRLLHMIALRIRDPHKNNPYYKDTTL